MKVIFLDFDGPMIPWRAYVMPNNNGVGREFDPIAVAMVNNLVEHTGARLVLSTAWAYSGHRPKLAEILRSNGINPDNLHDDWMTPRDKGKSPGGILLSMSRADEVSAWLAKHPEVTHWVAFDDDPVPEPGGIVVTFENGIEQKHFERARKLLGISP